MAIQIPGGSSSEYSYAGLTNYTNNTGIGSLKLDSSLVNAWSPAVADSFRKPFSTSPNVPDYTGNLLNSPASEDNSQAFTFITAPAQVSYSQGADVEQVSIFGANNPPLTVAGRNSGELQLSDALMEGFILGKQVQLPIENLFRMQQVNLDSKSGFVNVPVYSVMANERSYGNFVIENLQFDEEMRDLKGYSTRVRVTATFRQVPAYQINSGRDQATQSTSGANIIQSTNKAVNQGAGQASRVTTANGSRNTPAAVGGAAGAGGGASSSGQGAAASLAASLKATRCAREGKGC